MSVRSFGYEISLTHYDTHKCHTHMHLHAPTCSFDIFTRNTNGEGDEAKGVALLGSAHERDAENGILALGDRGWHCGKEGG